jgi:hypothetical protein
VTHGIPYGVICICGCVVIYAAGMIGFAVVEEWKFKRNQRQAYEAQCEREVAQAAEREQ